jgi:hypothetical protein
MYQHTATACFSQAHSRRLLSALHMVKGGHQGEATQTSGCIVRWSVSLKQTGADVNSQAAVGLCGAVHTCDSTCLAPAAKDGGAA